MTETVMMDNEGRINMIERRVEELEKRVEGLYERIKTLEHYHIQLMDYVKSLADLTGVF